MPATRTLYLVVHGVGDPEPGETTRDLARGLTAARKTGEVVAVSEER
ncbi:MAG TPA: hypothetical protein VD866_28390 [Urbifossiella sp.]|nr:hypothetical protein [Urbifossiella sp.]